MKKNFVLKIIFGIVFFFELIFDLISRLVKNICCCACCCCSWTFIGLLLAAFIMYNISASHQDYFNGMSQGVSTLNGNLVTLASNIDTCTPFIDKFVKLYNLTLKIIYSFAAKILDALGVTYQGQPVFSWAKQEFLAKYHERQYIIEKAFNDHIENTLNTYGYTSLDELGAGHQTRIVLGAFQASAAISFQPLSFSDILSACNILTNLVAFIIQILKLFNVFFINIFGNIVAALIKFLANPSNGFPNLLKIILDFFLQLLITEIPFAHCLLSPLDLAKCMCTPTNAGAITEVTVYLVGCIFESCDASVYSSGFVAIQYCIGLRQALDQLGVFGKIVNSLLDAVNALDSALGGLDGAINNLTNLVNKLLDTIGVSHLLVNNHLQKLNDVKGKNLTYDHQLLQKHFANAQQSFLNMPIYRGTAQYDYTPPTINSTFSFNSTTSKNAEVNGTWFDKWVAKGLVDDPTNPVYLEMKNLNTLMTLHQDVGRDLAVMAAFGVQILAGIHEIYSHPTYMSLEEMDNVWSRINYTGIFYSWDRLKNHTDKIDMNCSTLLIGNATKEQISMCNSSISYIEYLNNLEDDLNQQQQFLDSTKKGTMEGKSPLELQHEYEKRQEEMKMHYQKYQGLRIANQFHRSGVDINFMMVGSSSLLILAGVLTALTCNSFCGGCCNNSLGVCNAFGSCCPLILAILAIFIGNLVLNFFNKTYTEDDFVSPFFNVGGQFFLDLNKQQPSPEEVVQQFAAITGVITSAINNILIKIIQWGVKITAFGIPIIHLPDVQPGQTVIDWVVSLIFYPYFQACGTSSDCPNGGLCIRLIDPYNTSPDNYCTKECTSDSPCHDVNGQCFMAPFIVPGKCASQIIPTISVEIQPQCYNKSIIDFPIYEIQYTNGTVFKEFGWSLTYVKSSEFRWVLYHLGVLGFKWALFPFRMINVGFTVMPHGIFFSMLHNLPISIPGLDLITPLTTINYYVLPTVQSASHSVYNVVNTPSFWPFPTIASWWRFPNSDEFPPFGKALPAMYTCEVIYTPQAVIGLVIDALFIVILFTIVFSPLAFAIYEVIFLILFYFVSFVGNKGISAFRRKGRYS